VKHALAIACFVSAALARADEGGEVGRRVQALLREHAAEVYGCVEREAKPAKGEMLVRIFVGDTGRVAKAEVLKDEASRVTLESCLIQSMSGWDVRALGAAPGDQIVFPLAFQPGAEKAAQATLRAEQLVKTESFDIGAQELALYVARGEVSAFGKTLKDGDLVWMPKLGKAAIKPHGKEAVVLFVVTHQPIAEKARPAMRVVRMTEAPEYVIAGGKGRARIYLEGAEIAVERLTVDAGTTVPTHKHESSQELIYVASGKGLTTVAGKAMSIGPGDSVDIPMGDEHALVVEDKMVAVQVYAPAGPEQRFKGPAK
jgi:quercetin dioxygenase-like cupin family protein